MPRQRLTLCRRGLHRLDVEGGVYEFWDSTFQKWKRQCRLCHLARLRAQRAGRRFTGPPLEWSGPHRRTRRTTAPLYRPTAQELRYLQGLADGLTVAEVAALLFVVDRAVTRGLREVQRKYGVSSHAAAVAQGLKRGTIRPDTTTAARLSRTTGRRWAHVMRQLIRDERRPMKHNNARLVAMLDALLSWTEPHAVSVLWAAGVLTARDVPQTRNRYWLSNRARKRSTEDRAVCMNGTR